MTDIVTATPSAEEIAAAQAVMARLAAAQKAQTDAALPAIRVLLADERFGSVFDSAVALREQLPAGTPFHAHLGAVIVGMTNLRNDADAA